MNTLNIGANNFTMASGTLATNSLLVSGGANVVFSGASGAATNGGELLIRVNQSTDQLTIGTAIANNTSASSLTKSGLGKLVLTGTNTYSGGTTIAAGTISTSNSSGLGTGSVTIGNQATLAVTAGTLANTLISPAGALSTLNLSSGLTFSGQLSGSGTFSLTGTSFGDTRTFSAASTSGFTGAIQLIRGTYKFTGASADWSGTDVQFLPSNNDGLDILQVSGTGTTTFKSFSAISSATVKVDAGATLNIASGVVTVGLSQTGGSTFAPTSGTTSTLTSSGGALTFSGPSGSLTFTSGLAIADFNGSTPLSVVQNGGVAVTLNSANSFTGTTTINGGTMTLGNALALQNSTFVAAGGGTLSFGSLTSATFGGLQGKLNLALNNSSNAAVALTAGNNGTDTTYDGSLGGAGSLIKAGAGTLTLTNTETYTGTTTVSAGTLLVSGSISMAARPR